MTIHSSLSAVNARLTNLERCCDLAPPKLYKRARSAAAAIDDISNFILGNLRKHGFKAKNSDALRNVEAAVYRYLLESNTDESELIVAEGFGEHVDGPAGERILAQAYAPVPLC